MAAILAKQTEVALYYIAQGANPNTVSEFDGLTPIEAANKVGLDEVIGKLNDLINGND